jgi:putative membrane protein
MIKNIIKGIMIGIANIIPGVSGGTMAVSMGIYDKLIHCITHLFSEFKKSLKFLVPIFLGAGIGLVGLSFVIEFMFAKAPLPTNLLFIGLIVGGLPAMWKRVKGNKVKVPHILGFVVFFALVVGMALLGEGGGTEAVIEPGIGSAIALFLVGVLAAATMIIPGVSGSMVLLLIGYYNPILTEINNLVRAVLGLDMAMIGRGVLIFIPFGIGVIVGIFGVAKLVELVFEKFPLVAFWSIIGLIVASPIAILLVGELGTINLLSVVAGVAALAVGTVVAYKLGE